MAIDAGTAALIGVGGTSTAALLGVVANLHIGRDNAAVSKAGVERQRVADEQAEQDRAFVRLERENERLSTALAAERAAHDATRAELIRCRDDAGRLWEREIGQKAAPRRRRSPRKTEEDD